MSKPILCLDFDGVIHSYSSGWKGADVIPDPPVPGAIEFIQEASEHFTVAIYSSRSGQAGGVEAMQGWLWQHVAGEEYDAGATVQIPAWLLRVQWPTEKPPAMVSIDDRAITFTGTWPAIEDLKAFQPWNKKPPSNLANAVRRARGGDAPPPPKQGFA